MSSPMPRFYFPFSVSNVCSVMYVFFGHLMDKVISKLNFNYLFGWVVKSIFIYIKIYSNIKKTQSYIVWTVLILIWQNIL